MNLLYEKLKTIIQNNKPTTSRQGQDNVNFERHMHHHYLSFYYPEVIVLIVPGIGYHLYIVKNPSCVAEKIQDAIKVHVPDVQLESNVGAELSFILPKEQSAHFENLFTDLEFDQTALGIDSFGASVTTLEEVFLK